MNNLHADDSNDSPFLQKSTHFNIGPVFCSKPRITIAHKVDELFAESSRLPELFAGTRESEHYFFFHYFAIVMVTQIPYTDADFIY